MKLRSCYSCGESNVEIKDSLKKYNFRGDNIEIEVKILCCPTCELKCVLDSENQIVKKLHKEYIKLHNLYSADELKFIRITSGLSQSEFDEVIGLWKGTTAAVENGFALRESEMEKIMNWLNKN